MLIGIFSDTHLGFTGEDRYEESFARFKESIKMFRAKKVSYILHAGDLFDDAVPEQEVWLKTFECFAKNSSESHTSITKHTISGDEVVSVKGIPIIAIHGTHEYRGKDFSNAISVLEKANCLVHLHAGYVDLSDGEEKVFVHGLGGVPEKNAKAVLEKYDPKPIEGGTNMLLLHQSFKEFLPFDEDDMIASLSLSDLPNGFDLIIDGHLHWMNEQNADGKRFILTGSTIFTQMKNLESQMQKGVFFFDTQTKKLEFAPFANQRKLFYNKFEFKNARPEEVMETVNAKIAQIVGQEFAMKPLVRLKIGGTLAKGFTQSDISFSIPADKAVFSVSKDFSTEAFQKKIESLKDAQTMKRSVIDMGLDILEKNVAEAKIDKFDSRRMFDLLSIGENEKAEEVLISKN
ncbi:MAG: metallophosphoesterase [archaeon]